MIINDKKNFVSIVARMLKGLGYTDIKENAEDSAVDITAVKDGEKCCFKCRYDIDAVGEKYIDAFAEASGNYGKKIFVTNSSFISSAKKKAEEKDIELWDRNTIDRLNISVFEKVEDEIIPEKSSKGIIVTIAVVAILAIGAAAYWYFFR